MLGCHGSCKGARFARGTHRDIKVHKEDTVVMSSSAIPGNEALIWKTINGLARQGAHVLYGEGHVHVSGHAKAGEVKLMINLTRPKYAVPFHGEYRHLLAFTDLAMELGMAENEIFILAPGRVVEFRDGRAFEGKPVPGGSVNIDGLGVGDNTRALVITRGLAEMTRLGVTMGGRPETFAGLSGMGDLITTCISKHSRNRYVGEAIAGGRTLEEILDSMVMVAEGVRTTRSVAELSEKLSVEMPICEQMNLVLFEGKPPREAIANLMLRDPKAEHAGA